MATRKLITAVGQSRVKPETHALAQRLPMLS